MSKHLIIMSLRIVNSLLLFAFLRPTLGQTELRVGFYNTTCPEAESLVRGVVANFFNSDNSIPAGLLHMHFHDCFVRGYEASVLLDSIGNNTAEKEAGPNLSLRGFNIIDAAKSAVESKCPGIVSCADVLALATRDGVALAGGPQYSLPTGRRDGTISSIDDVNLPGPDSLVSNAATAFSDKGLSKSEMVTLLGAHTVGNSLCSFMSDRLYSFQGSGKTDPSMDPSLVARLKKVCPSPSSSSTDDPNVFLDQNTSFIFDNRYYKQLKLKHGILQIDQELASDKSTKNIVVSFATNGNAFSTSFVSAIIKMGNIGVLTGSSGQIRFNCSVVN